ncbi:alternative ribosome rescue aminoacyl-tRNA hydrolase ArfB [Chitinophaga sedimenti]|uniref:alternative ribosome rescue aminoacyl-tRNA hydrolase ArfB n=1 Tax=Chitinophaga sedimenti TaxID=2033606 RepID=UPI0035591126
MQQHIDITPELSFKTARSGGKGGQNVNKVETMVEAYFNILASLRLSVEQKALLNEKLASKINSEGLLMVKSQTERTQLGNKMEAINKINRLINQALTVRKKRVATKPTAAVKEKRIQLKKRLSEKKQNRRGNIY